MSLFICVYRRGTTKIGDVIVADTMHAAGKSISYKIDGITKNFHHNIVSTIVVITTIIMMMKTEETGIIMTKTGVKVKMATVTASMGEAGIETKST